MMRRQADEEGAAIANLGAGPGGGAENNIARKAATAKSRTKALARRLRKSSRMASLTADISEGIELIAGYSDGIIESFEEARHLMERVARESRGGAEILLSLAGTSAGTRAVSTEAAAALADLSAVFRQHEESLRGILAVIQAAAQTQSDIRKHAQELSHLNDDADELSGRLARMLERADISGLNAALEAGKMNDTGAGFTVVAAMVQKTSAAFERKAAEASGLLERVKTIHGSLSGKTSETAERIQAIGVMTKGVRNAFAEAKTVIEDLCAGTEEVAGRACGALDGLAKAETAPDAGQDITGRASGSIELAVTRLEEQEHRFAEAADRAEQLLASTGRLASAEDLPGALDTIYTDTDTFIRSIEATLERFELSLAAVHAAAHEMELLRTVSGTDRESLEHLTGTAGEIRDAALLLRDRIATLRASLDAARTVLRDVARELALLGEESAAIIGEIGELRPLYREISRLAGHAGSFAGRMDLLAVTGGMETARAGEAGAGFSALPGEFEAVAADASEVEQAACSLCDRLDDHLLDITGKQGKLDWKGLSESFDRLIAGMQDLLETRLTASEEKCAVLAEVLSGFSGRIEEMREKTAGMEQSMADAVRVIGEAGNSGESQRGAFRHTMATAEKISALADELYPEEE